MTDNLRIAYSFPSPCGSITVKDDRGCYIPFDVRSSGFETAFEADSGRVYNTPDNYIIAVPACRLRKGTVYRIALEGISLSVGCTDECSECVVGSGNGCSIAIGGSDPNEREKYSQFLAHRTSDALPYTITADFDYDRSRFVRYDLRILPDCSGFRFELMDDSCEEIVFLAAWLETCAGIEGDTEDAVQFWVL